MILRFTISRFCTFRHITHWMGMNILNNYYFLLCIVFFFSYSSQQVRELFKMSRVPKEKLVKNQINQFHKMENISKMKIYVKVIHFLVSRVFLNKDYFEFSPSAGCVLFIHQLCNCLFTNLFAGDECHFNLVLY